MRSFIQHLAVIAILCFFIPGLRPEVAGAQFSEGTTTAGDDSNFFSTNVLYPFTETDTDDTADDVATFTESSLVAGTMPFYLNYNGITWYNDQAYAAMIGSVRTNLFFGFGSDYDLFTQSTSETWRINFQLGGDATIWDRFLRLPLHIYIPIRLNSGFQHLSLNLNEPSPLRLNSRAEFDNKNFLNINFGAGAGASFRLPMEDIPLLGARISLDAIFVRSPGVMIRFIDDDDDPLQQSDDNSNEVGVSISNDLMLQARIHQFLESNIGFTAGVRFSGLHWSPGPDSFGDAINALVGDYVPENEMNYTALYLGINW